MHLMPGALPALSLQPKDIQGLKTELVEISALRLEGAKISCGEKVPLCSG